jgi:hypothetical protein
MEVFFVDDSSCNASHETARSFLARKAKKKRIAEQKRAKERSLVTLNRATTQEKQADDITRHDKVAHKPILELGLRSQQYLTPLERPIQLPSKRSTKYKCHWGVSTASCPNPAQAGSSAFRTSKIAFFIKPTIDLAKKVHLSKWENSDEQKRMQILALTYRGEAMKLARNQLSVAAKRPENSSSLVQYHRELSVESQFIIIFQLVLIDYFCYPAQAHTHFAASRKLVRSFTGDSGVSVDPVNRMPSFIHNRQLHHIMTAFEGTQHGTDSLFWDRGDFLYLQESLYIFTQRVSEANLLSASRDKKDTYEPRVHPQSLVWHCLTKVPENDGDDSFCELHGQLAVLIILCSIFMDYEPSTAIPKQCLSDLEDGLLTLGLEEASKNALNLAWLVAGGIGFPVESARQRLWSVMGMLYVFRQQREPIDDDVDRPGYHEELSEDWVKHACLEFLASNTA